MKVNKKTFFICEDIFKEKPSKKEMFLKKLLRVRFMVQLNCYNGYIKTNKEKNESGTQV